MRKLFVIVFLFPLIACAQVVDTARYEVWYDVTYKEMNERKGLFTNREVLEIGKRYSYYYSYQKQLYINFLDSMERANPDVKDHTGFYLNPNIPDDGNNYRIYKDLSNDTLLCYQNVFDQHFKYVDVFPVNNWRLEEGDTTILSMPCNKATMDLHGRHWTVWYTNDVPISDGPWKLKGLPGLILKAYESEGIFIFNCVGINNCDKPINMQEGSFINITPQKLESELKDFFYDQEGYIIKKHNLPIHHTVDKDRIATPCLLESY